MAAIGAGVPASLAQPLHSSNNNARASAATATTTADGMSANAQGPSFASAEFAKAAAMLQRIFNLLRSTGE